MKIGNLEGEFYMNRHYNGDRAVIMLTRETSPGVWSGVVVDAEGRRREDVGRTGTWEKKGMVKVDYDKLPTRPERHTVELRPAKKGERYLSGSVIVTAASDFLEMQRWCIVE